MAQYDYLIVGAGLFGCVFAQQMTARGKRCLIIDKRGHMAGNAHGEVMEGIRVHRYGAHIFHTSDEVVWAYVNRFAAFNRFTNAPLALFEGEVYNLPFNMNTFSKLWGVKTPAQAREIIARQTGPYSAIEPENLEQQALKLVGPDIYEKLIKGYTEKQWGRSCTALPAFIIRRLPLRFTYDNNYFDDTHQGVPMGGYDAMVGRMVEGTDIRLRTDYFAFRETHAGIAHKTVYTGMIDAYFDYCYGHLAYRTVHFEDEVMDCENWQGNAVVNYTEAAVPYTRIIEHKHFEFGQQAKTVISREYPWEWMPGLEAYYPVNDGKNQAVYEKYAALAEEEADVIFGGRLGTYRYYDMDKVIRAALEAAGGEP